jgi:hypothetical protein
MVEKKLVFGNNNKMKLKNYEIDWFNPEVITSESIKYLKKSELPPSTHESQLLFLMNNFEPGEIKLFLQSYYSILEYNSYIRRNLVQAKNCSQ